MKLKKNNGVYEDMIKIFCEDDEISQHIKELDVDFLDNLRSDFYKKRFPLNSFVLLQIESENINSYCAIVYSYFNNYFIPEFLILVDVRPGSDHPLGDSPAVIGAKFLIQINPYHSELSFSSFLNVILNIQSRGAMLRHMLFDFSGEDNNYLGKMALSLINKKY